VADQLLVPEYRTVAFAPFLSGEGFRLAPDNHLYRDSLIGLFSIGLLGPQIGGVRTALELVRESGPTRPVAATTYPSQAESPSYQLDLAQASMLLDTATLHAIRIAETVDRFARAGELPDLETRARARWESTYTTQKCREAMDILMTAYGTSAFNESNPLQRIWRDVNVASRHAGFGMDIPRQLYGRALVGRDPREISHLI
jgi:alkylation response protein AidB-like acyl-CoA dehydrogenase